jgi:hypothetical protein
MPGDIPKPWDAFLADLDDAIGEAVEVHCLGGFVIAFFYGLTRPTADIDVLSVRPPAALPELVARAGLHSALHKKHRVYIQAVTVSNYPESYDERLSDM